MWWVSVVAASIVGGVSPVALLVTAVATSVRVVWSLVQHFLQENVFGIIRHYIVDFTLNAIILKSLNNFSTILSPYFEKALFMALSIDESVVSDLEISKDLIIDPLFSLEWPGFAIWHTRDETYSSHSLWACLLLDKLDKYICKESVFLDGITLNCLIKLDQLLYVGTFSNLVVFTLGREVQVHQILRLLVDNLLHFVRVNSFKRILVRNIDF